MQADSFGGSDADLVTYTRPALGKGALRKYLSTHTRMCVCVCMCVCMYVCMYVCVCVCVCVCSSESTCPHIHVYVYVCMYVCMYVCVWTHNIDAAHVPFFCLLVVGVSDRLFRLAPCCAAIATALFLRKHSRLVIGGHADSAQELAQRTSRRRGQARHKKRTAGRIV